MPPAPAPDYPERPGYGFPGPVPVEALSYFDAKDLAPAFSYLDVWAEEHAAVFTVAKALELDVLVTLHQAVRYALERGIPYAQWRRDLEPQLRALGWWGRQERTDPLTGDPAEVQLGSPARLRTIYQANLRQARAAGQWHRIERTAAALPYLLYGLGPSAVHREQHVTLAGLCLPVSHPFWRVYFPPNGWGCKCWVRQISAAEYRRLQRTGVADPTAPPEIDPDTGLPTGRREPRRIPLRTDPPAGWERTRPWLNKRTGQTVQVHDGCDPGWDYNPGLVSRADQAVRQLGARLGTADPALAGAVRRALPPGLAEAITRL